VENYGTSSVAVLGNELDEVSKDESLLASRERRINLQLSHRGIYPLNMKPPDESEGRVFETKTNDCPFCDGTKFTLIVFYFVIRENSKIRTRNT